MRLRSYTMPAEEAKILILESQIQYPSREPSKSLRTTTIVPARSISMLERDHLHLTRCFHVQAITRSRISSSNQDGKCDACAKSVTMDRQCFYFLDSKNNRVMDRWSVAAWIVSLHDLAKWVNSSSQYFKGNRQGCGIASWKGNWESPKISCHSVPT